MFKISAGVHLKEWIYVGIGDSPDGLYEKDKIKEIHVRMATRA
jgi:hypothetical protein